MSLQFLILCFLTFFDQSSEGLLKLLREKLELSLEELRLRVIRINTFDGLFRVLILHDRVQFIDLLVVINDQLFWNIIYVGHHETQESVVFHDSMLSLGELLGLLELLLNTLGKSVKTQATNSLLEFRLIKLVNIIQSLHIDLY